MFRVFKTLLAGSLLALIAAILLLKPEWLHLVNNDVFRYRDEGGKLVYVSSLEVVPEKFRNVVEKNPDLPSLTRGEYHIPPTPIPTPKRPKRGGDGVIQNNGSRRDLNSGGSNKTDSESTTDKLLGGDSHSSGLIMKAIERILGSTK